MSNIKMICFGARKNEQPLFESLNTFGYTLTLKEELLTEENIDLIQGHNAVLLRANCNAKKTNLEKMKAMGVEYLLTRTVGTDHIDIPEATKLGFKMAKVPGYSPNAIAELGVSLAMMMLRNTAETTTKTSQGDFTVYPTYFSREVRNLTVGIVGVGKIGYTSASLFKGLGANILGFDVYPNDAAKDVLTFVSLDQLLDKSDIVLLHLPYLKGINDNLVNTDFVAKMKDNALLLNLARGEILDAQAVVNAIKSGKLAGFATDVIQNEPQFFNKNFAGKTIENSVLQEMVDLYPKVLITPHIGSSTDEAAKNMIEQSYENLQDFINTGNSKNSL